MSRAFSVAAFVAGQLVLQPFATSAPPAPTERTQPCTPRQADRPPTQAEARPGAVPSQPYASESISAFPPQFSTNGHDVQLGVGACDKPPVASEKPSESR